MTAKHQPRPQFRQAQALLSVPVMLCASWGSFGSWTGVMPTESWPSRDNRQCFGLAVIWVGFLMMFFGGLYFFFPFASVFHYNSSVFRHGKDIPDQQHTSPSDNVETSCFHKFSSPKLLCSEEFLPSIISSPSFPRRLWLGKPALPRSVPAPLPVLVPPAPAELGTRPPETLGPPRLWRSGNVAMAPAKKKVWKLQAAAMEQAGSWASRQHRAAGSLLQGRQGR